MRLPLIPMPRVWHIGLLDPDLRGTQHTVSYEGGGLSVSNCPEAWRSMAFLGGPTLRLDRPSALWIDLAALPSEATEAAVAHAVEAGLAEEREVWRAWFWEAGPDAWRSRAFEGEDEARAFTLETSDTEVWPRPKTLEGHLAALPEEAFPVPCESLGERVTLPFLTEAGNVRAHGFGRGVDASDILVAFWAEDALRPSNPDIVGTWWRERLQLGSDVAPRGAVLPCAVSEFAPTPVEADPDHAEEPATEWADVEPVHSGGPRPGR
jgi:hypothetical protein